jgi:hypothetical protein
MNQPQSLSDILTQYLRETGLEQPVLEERLEQLWPELMGPQVARLTERVEIKDGTLRIKVRSAALRHQLFDCRMQVIEKMNKAVNAEVIKAVRLL